MLLTSTSRKYSDPAEVFSLNFGSSASFIFFTFSTMISSASVHLRPAECSGSFCLASKEVLNAIFMACVLKTCFR